MEELNMENLPRKIWELKRTKRHVGWFHWAVLCVGIILIVYGQSHDTVAIEVPVQDGVTVQRLLTERDMYKNLYLKTMEDYRKRSTITESMLKTANMEIAKLKGQLTDLSHSSPPPQSVILEAVRREAATENGLRRLVARNFGSEIARRIEVRE